jgi:Tfp pilus assembly protein PilE
MKFNKKLSRVLGFTLIELVLAVSLVMLVGLGVYRALAKGIRLIEWQKTTITVGQIAIFFEKFAGELRNSNNYLNAGFSGSKEKVSFFVHDTDYLFLDQKSLLSSMESKPGNMYKAEY